MTPLRTGLLALAVLALAAIGWYRTQVYGEQAAGPPPQIVVVTGGSGPYWQLIANGARSAADRLDVEVDIQRPAEEENVEQQTHLLSAIELDQVDGVAISPLDADAQTPLINRLAERAVVLTFDSDAPLSERHSYVGASNLAAGQNCGRFVKEAIPEGGKVAVILANLTKVNMSERKEGFEEAINKSTSEEDGDSAYSIVDFLVDEGDEQRSEQLIRDTLNSHPDLACFVGMNAQHGPILLRVLEDEGKLDDVELVTFDEEQKTLDGIESGHIYATVAQDPFQYGYETVRRLKTLCQGSETLRPLPGARSTLTISTRAIKKEDVARFRKELKSRLAAPENAKQEAEK